MANFGWIPDLPDHRDRRFTLGASTLAELPSSVDLRPSMPPVQDQGALGSCTANAVAAAHAYQQLVEDHASFTPSRLFLYYNTRLIEGTARWDSGATLRDTMKAVARWGVCDEDAWPYDIRRFRTRPSRPDYLEAMDHQVIVYRRLDRDPDVLRGCLAESRPFVFGFTVYDSFLSEDVEATGMAPMPGPREYVLGGHAVLCVGYYDEEERFTCRNSWGEEWGNGGYFSLPYEYLLDGDLSDDFWTIQLIEP